MFRRVERFQKVVMHGQFRQDFRQSLPVGIHLVIHPFDPGEKRRIVPVVDPDRRIRAAEQVIQVVQRGASGERVQRIPAEHSHETAVPDPDPVDSAAFGKIGRMRQGVRFVNMIPGQLPGQTVEFGKIRFRLDDHFRQVIIRKRFLRLMKKRIVHSGFLLKFALFSIRIITPVDAEIQFHKNNFPDFSSASGSKKNPYPPFLSVQIRI